MHKDDAEISNAESTITKFERPTLPVLQKQLNEANVHLESLKRARDIAQKSYSANFSVENYNSAASRAFSEERDERNAQIKAQEELIEWLEDQIAKSAAELAESHVVTVDAQDVAVDAETEQATETPRITDKDFLNEATFTMTATEAAKAVSTLVDNFRHMSNFHEVTLSKPDNEVLWMRTFRGTGNGTTYLIDEVLNHPYGTLREVWIRGDINYMGIVKIKISDDEPEIDAAEHAVTVDAQDVAVDAETEFATETGDKVNTDRRKLIIGEETERVCVTISVKDCFNADNEDDSELLADLEHELDWIPGIIRYRVDAEAGVCATASDDDAIRSIEELFDKYGLNYSRYVFREKVTVVNEPEPEIKQVTETATRTVDGDLETITIGSDTVKFFKGKFYSVFSTAYHAAIIRDMQGIVHHCIYNGDATEVCNISDHEVGYDEFISTLEKRGAFGDDDEPPEFAEDREAMNDAVRKFAHTMKDHYEQCRRAEQAKAQAPVVPLTGLIPVDSGAKAFALVGEYFPNGLTFQSRTEDTNGADVFTFSDGNEMFLNATCTPDNRRIEYLEVINTDYSADKRKPLSVTIEPPVDEYAARMAELKADLKKSKAVRDNAAEKRAAKLKEYNDAQKAVNEAEILVDRKREAVAKFGQAYAKALERKLFDKPLMIPPTMLFIGQDGEIVGTGLEPLEILFHEHELKFQIVTDWIFLGEYDTSAQVETVIDNLKTAIACGSRKEFQFPTVDEVNAWHNQLREDARRELEFEYQAAFGEEYTEPFHKLGDVIASLYTTHTA